LLSAPAGAAMRLTDRPLRGMTLAGVIAVGSVWGGLAIAQQVPKVPPSFGIVALAAAAYLVAAVVTEPNNDVARRDVRPHMN
jgi:zinc/manganese transport system permease protein